MFSVENSNSLEIITAIYSVGGFGRHHTSMTLSQPLPGPRRTTDAQFRLMPVLRVDDSRLMVVNKGAAVVVVGVRRRRRNAVCRGCM
jgi:hypothetical protein